MESIQKIVCSYMLNMEKGTMNAIEKDKVQTDF